MSADRCPVCLLPVEPTEREREVLALVGLTEYRRVKTAWPCDCGFLVWYRLLKEAAAASEEK